MASFKDILEKTKDIKDCMPSFFDKIDSDKSQEKINIWEHISEDRNGSLTEFQKEVLLDDYGLAEDEVAQYSDWDDFEEKMLLKQLGDESNVQDVSDETDSRVGENEENLGKNEDDVYDKDGTRELKDKEKQYLKDTLGWSDKKINDNCRIDKDGVIHYKTDCQDKEGQTSECGVPYVRKRFDYNGITIEGVFPEFDSVFDTELDKKDYQSSSTKQFSECNKNLKAAIEKNPELKKQFTKEQLEDIENGRTPRGYTWHHTEVPGKMQLVKTEDHDRRIGGAAHTGGNSIWGNKSVEKTNDDNEQKGESF